MAGLAVLGTVIFLKYKILNSKIQINSNNQIINSKIESTSPPSPLSTIAERGNNKIILHEVPFTVQAPTGEWGDTTFQDGCEEASALALQCTIHNDQCPIINGAIDKNWAKGEIIKMAQWQREKYGSAVDTSAFDTGKRLLGERYEIRYMIYDLKTSQDIIDRLGEGNVLITPMDGQKLGNPNYTAPGPERHMVVVIGYDPKTDEIITNDGGTKRGQGYRYKRNVFWNAIRDYPTGDHEPILKIEKRAILVKV